MKIVILQSMYDSIGGIYYVNKELMRMFNVENYEIYLVSVRLSGYYHKVEYPKYIKDIIINSKEEWGTIRYQQIFQELKKMNVLKVIKLVNQRIKYNIKKDYKKTKKVLREINPDIIINSHYELLDSIPKELLKKTIMHFHTSFDIVKNNFSYRKIFNKYKNKIYKFVWLTKQTSDEAKKYGYKNSVYIYNSVRVKSNKVANVNENKNLIFLGRISKEKRLDIIINIFDELSKQLHDWTLSIYGIGQLTEQESKIVENNKNITFYGPINDINKVLLKSSININASDYEGFSMTILEANEFGIPTICFEFGESVNEEVKNDITGIVIKKSDIMNYKKQLKELMTNPDKLEELSKNCKEFNKNFSYEKIKKEWISLIKGEKNDEN